MNLGVFELGPLNNTCNVNINIEQNRTRVINRLTLWRS